MQITCTKKLLQLISSLPTKYPKKDNKSTSCSMKIL